MRPTGNGATWITLQRAAATGKLPAQELGDAGLVLVGGTLLLAPGFITDVVGYFFILPWTRPLTGRLLVWLLVRRTARLTARAEWVARQQAGPGGTGRPAGRQTGRPPRPPRPIVVEGELVSDADKDRGAPPDDEGPDSKRSGPRR